MTDGLIDPPTALPTGAEIRRTGTGARAVLCLNGTVRAARPGVWGASIEWLVDELAPRFPDLSFWELRYRVRSWREITSCVADGQAALAAIRDAGGDPAVLLGYSGGGAVALALSGEPGVRHTIALAPWLPPQLDPPDLTGRRFVAAHGSLDGLPFIPGTKPRSSRAGVARLAEIGADAHHVTIRGGIHQIAIRVAGRLVPAPRARAWRELVAAELGRDQVVAGASR